jgi:hypothetical protein
LEKPERILSKFLDHEVEFVMMGGHAAVFYGVSRTMSDMEKNRAEKGLEDHQDILALRRILKKK